MVMIDGKAMEPLMTVAEAASYLRLTQKTVRHRVAEGTIPSVKVGRSRRFRRSEIEAWIEAGGRMPEKENETPRG
jgi:excisionase family DNA binding protein